MRLFLLLLAWCAGVFAQSEKERALGAQLAGEYRRQARVLDSGPVNAYLDELGQRLAAHSGTGSIYTFELVDDEQTWSHEAPAFPGGPVFVPASLILAAADEEELASMLAHAIAHIATRRETIGVWSGGAIRQGAVLPLGFLPIQRKRELECDQAAVGILSAAGYDPAALARYIARVQPVDGPRDARAPYPDKDTRIAAVQAAIRQLPPATYSRHPGLDAMQREVARLTQRPARTPPRLAR